MRFTYEDTEYEVVEPTRWTTLEAAQLQRHTDMHPVDLWQDFLQGGGFGVHATVWITLRRAGLDVEWHSLELPLFSTFRTIKASEVPAEPPDPSSASTPPQSAKTGRRRSPAASRKKSGSTSS